MKPMKGIIHFLCRITNHSQINGIKRRFVFKLCYFVGLSVNFLWNIFNRWQYAEMNELLRYVWMEVEYNSANDNAMAAMSAVMWYLSLMNLINTIRTCSITSVSTTCPVNSRIFFLIALAISMLLFFSSQICMLLIWIVFFWYKFIEISSDFRMTGIRTCLIAIVLIAFNFLVTRADEILGCGGFVKSHADIDFSKVEVKL